MIRTSSILSFLALVAWVLPGHPEPTPVKLVYDCETSLRKRPPPAGSQLKHPDTIKAVVCSQPMEIPTSYAQGNASLELPQGFSSDSLAVEIKPFLILESHYFCLPRLSSESMKVIYRSEMPFNIVKRDRKVEFRAHALPLYQIARRLCDPELGENLIKYHYPDLANLVFLADYGDDNWLSHIQDLSTYQGPGKQKLQKSRFTYFYCATIAAIYTSNEEVHLKALAPFLSDDKLSAKSIRRWREIICEGDPEQEREYQERIAALCSKSKIACPKEIFR